MPETQNSRRALSERLQSWRLIAVACARRRSQTLVDGDESCRASSPTRRSARFDDTAATPDQQFYRRGADEEAATQFPTQSYDWLTAPAKASSRRSAGGAGSWPPRLSGRPMLGESVRPTTTRRRQNKRGESSTAAGHDSVPISSSRRDGVRRCRRASTVVAPPPDAVFARRLSPAARRHYAGLLPTPPWWSWDVDARAPGLLSTRLLTPTPGPVDGGSRNELATDGVRSKEPAPGAWAQTPPQRVLQ